jgi:predicted transcriptional regulator
MSHLNIYVSREREAWLRQHLEELAREHNRSLSYIIEEALVEFLKRQGHKTPSHQRKDHRTRANL